MKKLTALLLALVMLTFAFASCNGGDDENASPEGKTFAYEKSEIVDFENDEHEEFIRSLTVPDGYTFDEFIANVGSTGSQLHTLVFSFENGEMRFSSVESSFKYELNGKKITFDGQEDLEGISFTYENGKLVLTAKIQVQKAVATAKYYFKESK